MRRFIAILLPVMLVVVARSTPAAGVPGATWKIATPPEDSGWSSEKLEAAKRFAEQLGSDAVVIVDDGVAVAQWGDPAKRLSIYSMRKSLLSALIGIAVDDGTIKLDATLADLRIDDDEPGLTPTERQARVRDLLTSRSGVYHQAAYETLSNALARPPRGSHAPGAFFYYNNWDFNALGTIYEQQTRQDIFTAFCDKIATPVGMQDFRKEDGSYHRHIASRHPAYLFEMSARDLARLGLLYLRHGDWNGQQIISRRWVEESTKAQVKDARPGQNYGYMWWVWPESAAYEAVGKGGQHVWISPSEKLAIVHLIDVDDPGKADVTPDQFAQLLVRIRQARLPKNAGNR
jgi:CubicO group peptidase (beta-lactamase class C family)